MPTEPSATAHSARASTRRIRCPTSHQQEKSERKVWSNFMNVKTHLPQIMTQAEVLSTIIELIQERENSDDNQFDINHTILRPVANE